MSIETRINKIEETLRVGVKPKIYGTPIAGCEWTDKDEANLLAEAIKLGEDLPRPIMGGLSIENEMQTD